MNAISRSILQVARLRAPIWAAVIVLPLLAGCGDSGAPDVGAGDAEMAAAGTDTGAAAAETADSSASAAVEEPVPTHAPEVDLATMERSDSGLYTSDLEVGTGEEAKPGQRATVHYTGWLLDGDRFDSSVGRTPLQFVIGAGQVIAGWDQGVAGMRVGGRRRLVIPPELGYGAAGAGGGVIPPNATLVFDVELLGLD